MSLFESLGNQPTQAPANTLQMLQQLRQNPAQMLSGAGYNVPQGMTDPRQIVNHLMQSGQLTQGRLSQLQNMARTLNFR